MSLPKLGIDIAKRSYQVTLLLDKKKYHRTFRNQASDFPALTAWLAKHRVEAVQACLEATGAFWEELALYLVDQGHVVSVVNPARIHAYAQSKLARNKTDRLDADLIADFCQTQNPPAWTPPPAEVKELQALVRHLEDLQQMRTQEANRLGSGGTSAAVQQLLSDHLAFLDQQIQALQQRIQAHIDQHPGLRQQQELLASIPGIGELTAAKLLSENIQAFTSTRQLVAYAGLNPQQRDSGTSVRGKPRLSRIGRPSLRKTLYFPALSAMRFNPLVRRFCERLEKRSKSSMVILGAAMRKLLCLALGVLKSGVPFDPYFADKVQTTS
jgi:transposase